MFDTVMQTEIVSPFCSYGHPAGEAVPRIPDEYLEGAIYLYFDEARAKIGESQGGSGFLVAIDTKAIPGARHIYTVTNRHVIESGATVIRMNRHDGSTDTIDLTEKNWVLHPDGTDLAIAKIKLDPSIHKYKTLTMKGFVTKEIFDERKLGIGDEVFLVGRFIGSDGKEVNVPTVRFGNIAQNGTTILKDPQNRDQESYIIEGRSIGGFSGSPVYVHIQPMTLRPDQKGVAAYSWGPGLLGIDWCHPSHIEPLRDSSGPVNSGHHVHANSGFMGVIPAWKLDELLHTPDLVKERAVMEDVYKKQNELAQQTSDVAGPLRVDEGSDEDEVLRKMLSTPPKKS